MERKKYYKYMFLIGAIWNLVIGLMFIALSPLVDILVPMFGMEVPPSLIFYHSFFGIVTVFGIGYYLVARDITKNHGIVMLGTIMKFYAFVLYLIYFILGYSNFLPILFVIVDLIFACLFVEFFISFKKIE
ncbi:MAG: hypothetical protein ACFFDN_39395 [Candidatus Hodarchaeota archaeon]